MTKTNDEQPAPQSAVAIIPARYASTRFPGKPLARETGKYLIEHVYEQAAAAKRVKQVIVATDDQQIYEAVKSFGGEVVMTRSDHPNGTSRLAEVVAGITPPAGKREREREGEGEGEDGGAGRGDGGGWGGEVFVNVQGDEPELAPASIDLAIDALLANSSAAVSTLAVPIGRSDPAATDPNVVKVVCDNAGNALYFSRAQIPFARAGTENHHPDCPLLQHVGLYVYRRAFLLEYVTWPVTPLEATECLEQLRILAHGQKIAVAVLSAEEGGMVGIDTPGQYAAFVQRYQLQGEQGS